MKLLRPGRLPKLFLALVFSLNFIFLNNTIAAEFDWAPDFPVGAKLPEISARDQTGTLLSFGELTGESGLVLVMSRSYDWCPFCIAQLQRLVDSAGQFEALGFNVAAMTYDPVETLALVADDYQVTFPILYDDNVKHVNALGIRNKQYEPGERAYGIPEPGIFLLDAQGVIRAKFAEEDYRIRPDFSLVLEAAKGV